MPEAEDFKSLLAKALEGPLSKDDALTAFEVIMTGAATPSQIAGFLVALRARGESVQEIAAAASAMRRHALPVTAPAGAIDIVGTGGDGKGTLNISTLAAIVVAGAGVPVAKHGNKALSSKSGASDALALLGVNLGAPVVAIEQSLRKANLGYMAASNHHSAMKYVMPARTEMGIRTIFNILGPLTNPAGVKRQLTGAFSKDWIKPMAETLGQLGSEAAWLVHGSDGTDEVSIAGPTSVAALAPDGTVSGFEIHPEDAGLPVHPFEAILGGAPKENAAKLKVVLEGTGGTQTGAYEDAALLNAAAALVIAGRADNLTSGAEIARESIRSGAALKAISTMAKITASYG